MNKRKVILGTVVGGALLAAVGFGTTAQFQETFSSDGPNEINAAEFVVVENWGSLSETVSIDKFAPGQAGLYQFGIDARGAEVPVEITVDATVSGELAGEGTPVTFELVETTGTGYDLVDDDYSDGLSASTTDKAVTYALVWDWEAGKEGYDHNAFAGKSAEFEIEVDATQIVEKELVTNVYTGQAGSFNGVEIKFEGNTIKFEIDGKTFEVGDNVYQVRNNGTQIQVHAAHNNGNQGLGTLEINIPQGFLDKE
ncbi:hypothetical protein [Salipaludibacillus aurantiacus]|uniref:Spore coat-associated protein N n=1 Tax=Salipaludibacillus aurantiacus TaxID=1601833 RepID=A0A1H9UDB9_9BACI|nr:hypothetical protein [Salipaludibacillus aurantiacus]SES07063.1 hypothetical protein SAMN05518684_107121 [Salipaludibacillus aurantiacus]